MLQNYFKTILFLFSFFFFRFFLRVINAARALVKEARSLSLPSPPPISFAMKWFNGKIVRHCAFFRK